MFRGLTKRCVSKRLPSRAFLCVFSFCSIEKQFSPLLAKVNSSANPVERERPLFRALAPATIHLKLKLSAFSWLIG